MDPGQKNSGARGYGQGYAYFGMALNLPVAILLFGAAGWFLDGWIHTRPLFAIIEWVWIGICCVVSVTASTPPISASW